MHVKFTTKAEADIDGIHDYIAPHSQKSALSQIDRIYSLIELLESFPLLGKGGRLLDTREITVPGTSYIVVYSLPDQYHVVIETILHTSRKYP